MNTPEKKVGAAKVLIVDDRKENLFAMRKILSTLDAELFEAESGSEALSLMLRHQFALVLLDVQMPEMDGFEVAEIMQEHSETSDTPIIFVTAFSREEQHCFRGYESGAVDYLFKPIDPEILLAKVKVFIELFIKQRDLEEERRKAEAASEMKTAFLANMSHEIRTPLNSILGMSEVLSECELGEEERRYIGVIQRCGSGLLEIINAVLDISKIEAGELQPEKIDFNLEEIAEKSIEHVTTGAREKKIGLVLDFDSHTPHAIRSDPTFLRQTLINLLSNAVKFSDRGAVVLKIKSEKQSDKHCKISFSVTDNGIGIPEDRIDAIFDSFVQADGSTTRKFGGTGLGLTISKRMIELLGGSISVTSKINEGTTFSFHIPVEISTDSIESPHALLNGMSTLIIAQENPERVVLENIIRANSGSVDIHNIDPSGIEIPNSDTLIAYDAMIIDLESFDDIEKNQLASFAAPELANKVLLMIPPGYERTKISQLKSSNFTRFLVKPLKRRHIIHAISNIANSTPESEKADDRLVAKPLPLMGNLQLRVLIAEDVEDNIVLLKTYLKDTEIEIDFAEDGEIAVDLFKKNAYDLVIMDTQMPIMGGDTATKLIRAYEKDENLKHTPIVSLSADAFQEAVQKSIAAGSDDYMTKPVKKEELLSLLTRVANGAYKNCR